jgi:signal transduction histidine kinase
MALYEYIIESPRIGPNFIAALVCFLAAYTFFSLTIKNGTGEKLRYPWLIAASVALGCGAWAVNLIMLLAYQTQVPFTFEMGPIVFALAVGMIGCSAGLFVARRSDQMPLGGAIVGLAIAAMFFTQIQGVHFAAKTNWSSLDVAMSVLLGASFGAAALSRGRLLPDIYGRLLSALMLSAGVMSTHFVGLAALNLTEISTVSSASDITMPVMFGIALTAVIMLIIGLGIVGALVDRYVGEIETAKDQLEARVTERTDELSAAKLRAESAARAKSEFLASMSHELRTPLNAIIGFSDMIAHASMGPIDPRYSNYGTDIFNSGQHLLSLVNEVLDLSKLESGRFELHEEQLDIAEVLDSCREMVTGLANKAGVELTIDLDPNLHQVWADPLRIKQIVVNLLSNAIKFTEAGGHVFAGARMSDTGETVIDVQDTGIGMRAQDIEKALEPFGQIDSPMNRGQGGTGLGLPVVKHLIELHGGKLTIVSDAGAGTSVSVRLPAAAALRKAVAS